jgi:parallel beta-helix repeat protein
MNVREFDLRGQDAPNRKPAFIPLVLGLALAVALLWLLSLSGSGPPVVRAASYTVCPAGPPACDYNVIQHAVDAARNGDLIKVAAGTYEQVNDYYDLAQVVYLAKSITIRGGYTTAFAEPPDPVANPTTLDAGGRGRVIYIQGPISPTIEGLRITGGDATVLGSDQGGGGVQILHAECTVRNNVVFSNTAHHGGGLHLHQSPATLSGNTISDNFANGDGGGLNLGNSAATLSGNTISSNSADWGGGLFLNASAATLSGNTVSSNTAVWNGGGLVVDYSAATLTDNTISNNSSGWNGGGLNLLQSPATLSGNTVSDNSADDSGGGLSLTSSDATLTNNVIADNQAGTAGSGLYITGSLPSLLHTTLSRSGGGDGRGIFVTGDSTIALTNTILVGHLVGIRVDSGSTATLESTLWGNEEDWEVGGTFTHSNDYEGDPDFVDPDYGDYHIGGSSAALDAGVDAGVTTDIDFHPRPYLDPDLGADEYWPPGTLTFVHLPLVMR